MSSSGIFQGGLIHLQGKKDLRVQSHYLHLVCARLDAGFTGGDLLLEGVFGNGIVRLACGVLICVSILLGFCKYVCNLSVTPGKWQNPISGIVLRMV